MCSEGQRRVLASPALDQILHSSRLLSPFLQNKFRRGKEDFNAKIPTLGRICLDQDFFCGYQLRKKVAKKGESITNVSLGIRNFSVTGFPKGTTNKTLSLIFK